jgi:hypothetical protein
MAVAIYHLKNFIVHVVFLKLNLLIFSCNLAGLHSEPKLIFLLPNVRIGWKWVALTNAPFYYTAVPAPNLKDLQYLPFV